MSISAASSAARRGARACRAAASALAAARSSPRDMDAANAHSARTAASSSPRRGRNLDAVMGRGDYRPLSRAGKLELGSVLRRKPKGIMIGSGLPPEEVRRAAWSALWTFPSILLSSFVVAWGAECAQFYISQGLALALLAWIQVLPEFAVEAVISWHRDVPLMTANFTGALRLLTGLGWPTIWTVYAIGRWRRGRRDVWKPIELDEEHAAEVVGLIPALVYWAWIIYKGSLGLVDAGILLAIYTGYLVVVNRIPPKEHEEVEDVAAVARFVIGLRPLRRKVAIAGLFLIGGTVLYLTAQPFLTSMIGLATVLGVSQFVFVQWVAPFLSELPEFLTTSYWARSRGKAGMALMNMVSSNVNQWTVLAAMIPIVYSFSLGHPSDVPMAEHRVELMLTMLQGSLGMVLLANLNFQAYEALGLLLLWFAQFLVPHWREEISIILAVWLAVEIASVLWRPGRLRAFTVFPKPWHKASEKKARENRSWRPSRPRSSIPASAFTDARHNARALCRRRNVAPGRRISSRVDFRGVRAFLSAENARATNRVFAPRAPSTPAPVEVRHEAPISQISSLRSGRAAQSHCEQRTGARLHRRPAGRPRRSRRPQALPAGRLFVDVRLLRGSPASIGSGGVQAHPGRPRRPALPHDLREAGGRTAASLGRGALGAVSHRAHGPGAVGICDAQNDQADRAAAGGALSAAGRADPRRSHFQPHRDTGHGRGTDLEVS